MNWTLQDLCNCVIDVTSMMSGRYGLLLHESQRVLPAVEKLTVPRDCLQPLHPDTGAQLHFFCRNVSYRRCVNRLPSAIRHVHVYVWVGRVGGVLSRCRRWKPLYSHSTFTSGKKEWAVVYLVRKLSSFPARLRPGRKSGRLINVMTLMEDRPLRPHSTFTSGTKVWAVV